MKKGKPYPINFENVTSNLEFYQEVAGLQKRAEEYLQDFSWCQEIKRCYLYTNLGRVFCVFLFEVVNSSSPEDSLLWVIAGDIPFMYLNTAEDDTIVDVVKNYIDLAQDWINQITNGLSVEECYPFKAEPTKELADLLQKRITFMNDTLLYNIENLHIEA